MFDSRFFDEAWPTISRGLESEADAESEVGWILDHVQPPAAGRVLDAPCGFGRHSMALVRRGFEVTGVDLSETELQRAKERAAAAGLPLQLVRQDMRDMDFSGEFDLALNLFSSIGFFTDDEDRLLIDRFCTGLKPGGAFVLDTRNRDFVTGSGRTGGWRPSAATSGGSRSASTPSTSSCACSAPSGGRTWSCSAASTDGPSSSSRPASCSWRPSSAR